MCRPEPIGDGELNSIQFFYGIVIGGNEFKIPMACVTERIAFFIAKAAASAPAMVCTSANTVVSILNTFDSMPVITMIDIVFILVMCKFICTLH